VFVYYLFVRGIGATGPESPAGTALAELFVPLWPALLALVVSHGVSFITNFLGRKEYVGRTVRDLMGEPYKRIIILHVTIILGGGMILLLGSPLPALILLIGLKTVVDFGAHRKEHRAAGDG
jgi:putative flippase GtrA